MTTVSCAFIAKRLAMGWAVRDSNPDMLKAFRNRLGRPRGPTSLLGHHISFPGVKGRDVALNSRG